MVDDLGRLTVVHMGEGIEVMYIAEMACTL